ncbi:MAG: hypothetical protein LUQ09_02835 [Methanomassiliicoccales archaeon]|nr:hypothetical protein [Methanomassiliicoccales archaeon]
MTAKKSSGSKTKVENSEKSLEAAKVSDAEPTILDKNPIRSMMFKDVLLQEIVDGLKAEQVPKEDMEEVLFLTVTNAVLEQVGMNLSEELLLVFQENLDDYLAISMINREHNIDILSLFRDQFLEAQGDSFDDERALMEALTAFEDEWWGTPKDFLGGSSPNDLMDQAKDQLAGDSDEEEHEHEHEHECECEDCGDSHYWAARSYAIRDMWLETIIESVTKESMPTPQRRERLFISLTNALLDLVVNVMPDFMTEDLFVGLDQALAMALVDKESKVELMQIFQDALAKFEEEWWGTELKELGGKSPDEAVESMARKYGL